jgi:hypothetical protein
MKKLIVLLSIMMLKSIAFSQAGTDTIQVKTFPIPTVKLIIKDIIRKDSLAAELKMTQDILNSVESEVKLKDSIILRLYEKDVTNVEILRLEREKYDIVNGYSKKVEQELKKEKSKNKLVNIIYSSIIGVLTILLITK